MAQECRERSLRTRVAADLTRVRRGPDFPVYFAAFMRSMVAMEFGFPALLLFAPGLGLLGFVEPCTVGAHLVFVRAILDSPLRQRLCAVLVFVSVRTVVMGSFGALIALSGRQLIGVQSGMWLVFGSVYLLIGMAYAFDLVGAIRLRIALAPAAWRQAGSPAVLGAAFGLNIPACAAPILFGLIAMAASSGAMALGFFTMAAFALALSAPLVLLVIWPAAMSLLARLTGFGVASRPIISLVFIILGGWSVWFGLFVDPADWASP
jgi:cytochrome c-type biogenesis protein